MANRGWLTEARVYQAEKGLGGDLGGDIPTLETTTISPFIFRLDEASQNQPDPGVSKRHGIVERNKNCSLRNSHESPFCLKPGPYYPIWQTAPVLPAPADSVNLNVAMFPSYSSYLNVAASTVEIAIGGLDTATPGDMYSPDPLAAYFAYLMTFAAAKPVNYTGEPFSIVFVPVVDSFANDRKTVAVINAVIRWASYFENILTDSAQPVHVVLSNTCDGEFTYKIQGANSVFVGKGNLANSKYEDMALSVDLDESQFIIEPNTIALKLNQDVCRYSLRIYPTREGDEYYNDFFPLLITLTVAAVFLMTATVFYFYDVMVERRQKVVLDTAQRSTAIVSSIFPKKVRDQLLQAPVQGNATKLRFLADARKHSSDEDGITSPTNIDPSSGPIADLFPNCTGEYL